MSSAEAIRPDPGERYARADVTSGARIDLLVAVAAFAASLGLLVAHGEVDAVGILLTAASSLPLLLRRRAPLAVFVVTAAASSLLSATVGSVGPPIGPTLALYWTAAAGEGSGRGLAIIAAMVAAQAAANALGSSDDRFLESLYGALLWGGAWLAGDRTRLRQARMATLEERARSAEREAERERRLAAAEERGRIARDLHDSAGHAINVILVHAGMGRLHSERDPELARDAFVTIEQVASETVSEIDDMVRVLREDAPAGVDPPPGLAAFDALVERHRASGLEVTIGISGERRRLSPAADRAAYRILQEALTNAARHGEGSAQVQLGFDPGVLTLAVTNPLREGDSTGAVPDRPGDRGGHGVIGMRERAALIGGSVQAGPEDGRFVLHAHLPLNGRA